MVGCLIREMDLRPPFESNDNIINSNLDQSSKNIIILPKIFVLYLFPIGDSAVTFNAPGQCGEASTFRKPLH